MACDERGNIDVADLEAKAREYSSELCGLMVTYPSTHGVFQLSLIHISIQLATPHAPAASENSPTGRFSSGSA